MVAVSQLVELRKTIAALRLRPEHAALVAQCEGLAAALDEKPTAAALWREYRPAVEQLLTAGEAEVGDGEASFLRLVSSPVGDETQAGKGDAGPGGRRGGGGVGSTVDAVAAAGGGRRPRASA